MARLGRGIRQSTQYIYNPIPFGTKLFGRPVFEMFSSAHFSFGGTMSQFARPIQDIVTGGWSEDDGTTTTIFDQIDEEVPDDVDYIRSSQAPVSPDVYACKLSPLVDPVQSAGHIIRFRYGKDTSGGAAMSLTIQLRQAYVNEGNQGTLIATVFNATDIAVFPVAGSYALSGAEADLITNYGDLYLRFVAQQI